MRIISPPNTYVDLPPLEIGKIRLFLATFIRIELCEKPAADEKFKVRIENVFDMNMTLGADVMFEYDTW